MSKKPSKKESPKFNLYQVVTDRIIASLKAGVIPWEKPWKASQYTGGPLSMRVDEASAAAGFTEPGSTVDILAVYKPENAQNYKSSVVLQNVTVLAVGQRVETDPDNKHPNEDTVTVLVTPEEATRLSLASSIGKLQFMLRNETDQTLVEGLGDDFAVDTSQVSHVRPELHTTAGAQAANEVAKAASGYQVEIFAGGTSTKQTFAEGRP